MHVVPLNKVNQYLPGDKLEVTDTDIEDLEETARDIVFSRLQGKYDITGWGNAHDELTPSLVVNILGMYVAGLAYNRIYAEDNRESLTYGDTLIANATGLLDKIVSNELVLNTASTLDDDIKRPSYLESDPLFEMGTSF